MADLEKEVLDSLKEAGEELLDKISNVADNKLISYSDFKLVEALKDELIVCASLIVLRDHGPLSAGERSLIETAQMVTRKLIEAEKERR